MKKIIGLTCKEHREMDFPSQATNEDYIDAVIKGHGVPVLLPICDEELIDNQLDCIDGLIVCGGIDVNPLIYHDIYRFEQSESSLRRDLYELKLIQKCIEKKIPILGICRGHQMINVALGGTLYQDNKQLSSAVMQHQQEERKDYPIHSIQVDKDSFLYPIFNEQYYVNSFHHQSIQQLGKGLRVVARSDDQIIEAIQHEELDIWGVQFHPEMMHERDAQMQEIFSWFIQQCS